MANKQDYIKSKKSEDLHKKGSIHTTSGKVTIVGFGPGDFDLLTIGGDKALAKADVIFHDDLLDKEALNRYKGEKVYVGKRQGQHHVEQEQIHEFLLSAAKAGKNVVRLKGGDPMIFAHGGEEVGFLENYGIEVNVIPGVSSGIAVASLTKTPLTYRNVASSVAFISGHSDDIKIPECDTLVYFMGGSNIQKIAMKAIKKGKKPDTPVMLTYNVSRPDQKQYFSTLKELSVCNTKYPTPIIIIIGEVVKLRNRKSEYIDQLLRESILV